MSEDVSRRKALSLLGLGAVLGFTLSAALGEAVGGRLTRRPPEPRPPRPVRPPGPTGCNGGKGGAPIVMSDATAAMNDATSGERVRNQKRHRLPERAPAPQ